MLCRSFRRYRRGSVQRCSVFLFRKYTGMYASVSGAISFVRNARVVDNRFAMGQVAKQAEIRVLSSYDNKVLKAQSAEAAVRFLFRGGSGTRVCGYRVGELKLSVRRRFLSAVSV